MLRYPSPAHRHRPVCRSDQPCIRREGSAFAVRSCTLAIQTESCSRRCRKDVPLASVWLVVAVDVVFRRVGSEGGLEWRRMGWMVFHGTDNPSNVCSCCGPLEGAKAPSLTSDSGRFKNIWRQDRHKTETWTKRRRVSSGSSFGRSVAPLLLTVPYPPFLPSFCASQ
ncbi:hypothetical protein C8R46DRAFT_380377 [Mycena filopes]|nr:hypothetical protein C8R46DRAFT_380377 [Mycena filopes]